MSIEHNTKCMIIYNAHGEEAKIYEGVVPDMSEAEKDAYKAILGDGSAKVTVGTERSESDYGRGGKVFVSVTLTCGQSANELGNAAYLASNFATHIAETCHEELKKKLVAKGIHCP